MKKILILLLAAAVAAGCAAPAVIITQDKKDAAMTEPKKDLETLQREFVELRYGMFIHFGILTYTGVWSQANLDISKFDPTELNPGQWADAAKAAGMKFGVLTTRHHDGFALWPTSEGNFSVKNIPWRRGKGDVVREYVDAFRSRGLLPGLYYSVWDNTEGVGNHPVTQNEINYVKVQLKELLTNYGPIPILVLDGYSWKMGHKNIPYDDLRAFIKSIQPNCLVVDHTHLQCLYDDDLLVFEEPRGVFAPEGNILAAAQDNKIIGGNDWFWGEQTEKENPMSVDDIVNKHLKPLEKRYTVFILNCPPNRKGLLDDKIVKNLTESGKIWKPDMKRKPLPKQPPQNEYPVTAKSAEATSGNAAFAIDGQNDSYYYSIWETSKSLPQSITLDLGNVYDDIGILCYVPKYKTVETPTNEGAVTEYAVYTSVDNEKFTKVSGGRWKADSSMKTATFDPERARYVKFEVIKAKDGYGAATEISVGRRMK